MIALRIEVRNAPIQRIDLINTSVNQNVGVTQGVITVPVYKDIPEYQGVYDVTPKVVEQRMETKDKFMRDDMTIKSIPFFNVSNTSGGSTVYIGNEV